jgi:hypothetical protein
VEVNSDAEEQNVNPVRLFDKLVLQIKPRIRTGPKNVAHHVGGSVFQAQSITYTESVISAETVPVLVAEFAKLLGPESTRSQLVRPQPPALPVGSRVEIGLGTKLSIIKAWDLPGGRVHLPFEVRNESDEAVSITDAEITLNGCVLTAKQFFINNGAVRIPDPATTFPVVVEVGKTAALNIEFENLGAGPVYSIALTAELCLQIDPEPEARVEFVANELYGLAEMLPKMQAYCDQHHTAIAFDMPIGSDSDA